MNFLNRNEFWLFLFAIGLLYWLFNPTIILSLVMILPLLLATITKK